MDRDSLIDAYTVSFAQRIAHRADRDDLVAEVTDHLHCAVERRVAEGADRAQAEHDVLDRFGDARLVSALVSGLPADGGAASLFVSRRLPWLSGLATLVWSAIGAVAVWRTVDARSALDDASYFSISTLLACGVFATTVTLVGAQARARGVVDDRAMAIGLIGTVVGTLVIPFAWMVPLWIGAVVGLVSAAVVRVRGSIVCSRASAALALTGLALTALATVGTSAVALAGVGVDSLTWIVILGLAAVLAVWHLDVAVRAARTAAGGRPVIRDSVLA